MKVKKQKHSAHDYTKGSLNFTLPFQTTVIDRRKFDFYSDFMHNLELIYFNQKLTTSNVDKSSFYVAREKQQLFPNQNERKGRNYV